jgi:adenine-specific DNA-methyltransferase
MAIDKLRPAFTFTEDRLAELRAVVPEAFADGAVNWEALREALGAYLEDEGREAEHFGLTWPGKRQARRLAAQPSKGTLLPAPGEGVDEANTRNLFIEGDNLEVLKLLQKSYAGRVKMIYIDPPYNTGQDFVYNDDFSQPLEEYLRHTGQIDEAGQATSTNPKAGGRFHSNWLNMIFPRLLVARSLLREDGIVMVSIDDNEVHNLRAVMNEVFGEENYLDTIIWKKRYGGGAKEKFLVTLHEYVVIYALSIANLDSITVPNDPDAVAKYYRYKDEKFETRGPYRTHPLEATKSMGNRPNLVYGIPAPNGSVVWPKRQWLWSKDRSMRALENNDLEFVQGRDGITVHTKQYLRDDEGTVRSGKMFTIIDNVFSQHGTNEILELFGDAHVFPFPKPTGLITPLLQIGTSPVGQDIVLDFFAGSGTTANAIMALNRKDGGNRRFICVQLPEPISNSNFQTISQIGKERIRRVSTHLKQDPQAKLDLQDGSSHEDLGFRVYKLGRSNYKAWQDYQGGSVEELQTLFDRIETPLVDGWKRENVLSEVLLLQGFPLDSAVADEPGFKANRIQRAESDAVGHRLFVCLDDQIRHYRK